MSETNLRETPVSEHSVPGSERRATVRFACDLASDCYPLGAEKGVCWPAMVRNISTRGLGLVLCRRFEPGTILSVAVQRSGQALERKLLVRVVHVQPASSHNWFVGCAFITRLSEYDLQGLL